MTGSHLAPLNAAAGALTKLKSQFVDWCTGGRRPPLWLRTDFFDPMRAKFRRISDDEALADLGTQMLAAKLAIYPQDTIRNVTARFVDTRDNAFWPTDAEILRECERIDRQRPERWAMQASFPVYSNAQPKPWPADLGPAPGEPGCFLSQELQDAHWRKVIHWSLAGLGVPRDHKPLIAWSSLTRKYGWTPARCPIAVALRHEAGLPVTDAEVEAAMARYKIWYAQREAEREAWADSQRGRRETAQPGDV